MQKIFFSIEFCKVSIGWLRFVSWVFLLIILSLVLPISNRLVWAQTESSLSYSRILAAGIKAHYGDYLRGVAQSFEGKDRNPELYSRWPRLLLQENTEGDQNGEFAYNQDYDIRVSETWEFLDYQLAYAKMRGTIENKQKRKILAAVTMTRLIDESIDIYWKALVAERYGDAIRQEQVRINKLLRDSRLSNIVNTLLPHEKQKLLEVRNKIITTLRSLQENSNRFNQFIGSRGSNKIKALTVSLPVSYYNGEQLDQSGFRVFIPFGKVLEDANDFITQKRAYAEIERLFPSVRFDVGDATRQVSRRDTVRWHNYSSQLGWNLSNVFKTYRVTKKGLTREHARSASMVIVARNRIALIEYQQSLANFDQALLNYNNSLWAQANLSVYDQASMENIAAQVEKIIAAVQSSYAFASLQRSYFRLLVGGGYVVVDNINPLDDEKRLKNVLESSIERLLLADSIELGNQIDRSILSEHSDSPEILRILQAWQQALALILSSAHGTKAVNVEDSLPDIKDNIQNIGLATNSADDLVSVAESLPAYQKSKKPASAVALVGTAALVSRVSMQHQENLEQIEKIGQVADQVNEASLRTQDAAKRVEKAANTAVEAVGAATKLFQEVKKKDEEAKMMEMELKQKLAFTKMYFPRTPADAADADLMLRQLNTEKSMSASEKMKMELEEKMEQESQSSLLETPKTETTTILPPEDLLKNLSNPTVVPEANISTSTPDFIP